jgi:LIM homeobox transcription factor 1
LFILFDIRQVWFQNQRAKMKKIQKKARQENKINKDDECNDDKSQKTKVKEEEQSKHLADVLLKLL